MTTRSFVPMLAVVGVAALGCGRDTEGGLGQAHVSTNCPSEDLTCIVQGLEGPLAVGGTAQLNAQLEFQGSAPVPTELRSSHPGIFSVDGNRVLGKTVGHGSLLIMLANQESVVDFMHLWVVVPDRLALVLFTPDGRELGEALDGAELLPGESLLLASRFGARGQRLVGDPDATWTTDSDVVTLLREPTSARMRAVARKPGVATISVGAGALTSQLRLEVKP
jgi:hypothetical protein